MKKRIITVMVAALALLTLTAVSNAAAPTVSGVLVRTADGYIITGTIRDALNGQVVAVHGTLIEQTTGFNTCPYFGFASDRCFPLPGVPPPACNLLGGGITLNFQGTKYEASVTGNINGRIESSLCRDPDDPTTYSLTIFAWSTSHVPPGQFPDIFQLGGTVQQISPTVFKWS